MLAICQCYFSIGG